MNTLRIYKVSALPENLSPNAIYVVNPPQRPDYVEVYITSKDTNPSVKRIPNEQDILNLINNQLAEFNTIHVVNNIQQRNNLNPTRNIVVLVVDASGDPTVSSGSATYVYNTTTQQWIKISEWESMDLSFTWSGIDGRPQSSPQDIDDAVAKRHTHSNMNILNKLSEDNNGNLLYDNKYIMRWEVVEW